jgi:hypothetical protein
MVWHSRPRTATRGGQARDRKIMKGKLVRIEAIHTYEGTKTIQTLIVGGGHHRASAFA